MATNSTLKDERANSDQIHYWNEVVGPAWVQYKESIDQQIRWLGERAMGRSAIVGGARVLDVGCGCGDSTLEIARRVQARGEATGIDISSPMLEQARNAAAAAGLQNVRFIEADVQVADIGSACYDVLFSRFGLMFFDDPNVAFKRLHDALRPGGQLAFVCWQNARRNPWATTPVLAAARHVSLPPPPSPDAPGMFSLGSRERVLGILERSGFQEITFEDVAEPLLLTGVGSAKAAEMLLEIGPTASTLRQMGVGQDVWDRVLTAARNAIAPFDTPEGIRIPSSAWLVTANRCV